jgi:hypothetical protein
MHQGALTKAVARAHGCFVAPAAEICIIRGEGGILTGIEIATKKSNSCSEPELKWGNPPSLEEESRTSQIRAKERVYKSTTPFTSLVKK